jgi:hypothetical protein
MTRDLDLVLNRASRHGAPFGAALRADVTFLPQESTDAVGQTQAARADRQQRARCCADDTTTGFQLDVDLATGHPFDQIQVHRAVVLDIPGDPGGSLRVVSAEDMVLTNLEWYAMTPSDRHWRDVQAVLRVQGAALDQVYLG